MYFYFKLVCERFGAYLAEINDKVEDTFLQGWVNNINSKLDHHCTTTWNTFTQWQIQDLTLGWTLTLSRGKGGVETIECVDS